jgi:diacylglycerol kinase (ATP)
MGQNRASAFLRAARGNFGLNAVSTITENARQVLIGVNPRAGAGDRMMVVDRLERELASRGFEVDVFVDVNRLAEESAAALAAQELRAVVAAGGDGTLRLIAERTSPGAPLLALPLGTENLLARYLGLSADPIQIAAVIAEGLVIQLDAGQAGNRLFALMAGCGFDAEVVRRLHHERQGHIHHLSYAKPIFDSILEYGYPELRVVYTPVDAPRDAEPSAEITARWVFVVNLPRYAGGLSFSPSAVGTDGLLDVCTFKEGSLWHGLMYLGGVMLGQHEAMQDFVRVQTRRLRIEAAGRAPYQLDGDPGGDLPVEISVLPRRLTLLVARSWIEQQPAGAE